jgi:hypothetical protein
VWLVQAVLDHVYLGKAPAERVGDKLADRLKAAEALLDAAEEYLLPELSRVAEDRVLSAQPISMQRLPVLAAMARKRGLQGLEERCLDFLGANLLSVLADRGLWKKLPWKYRGEAFARMSAEDKRTLESVLKMNALRESRHALRATQQTRVTMDRREVEPELRRQVSAPDLIGSRGMPNLAVMIATSQALFDEASPASAPAVVRQRSCA